MMIQNEMQKKILFRITSLFIYTFYYAYFLALKWTVIKKRKNKHRSEEILTELSR